MNKEIIKKIKQADEKIRTLNLTVELTIVGGAAFILTNIIPRSTTDIDYINIVNERVAAILNRYEINSRVRGFELTFGEWQDDLKEINVEGLTNIKINTISIERLLASRLFSRKRFSDFEHGFLKQKLNQKKFEEIIIEICGYADPTYLNEWKENNNDLIRLYKEKGWDYEKSNIKKLCQK